MTKYEMVVALVMQQLEDHKAAIEDGNIEQLAFDMRFKPHGGMPRSAKMQVLHSYEGSQNGGAIPRQPRPTEPARA